MFLEKSAIGQVIVFNKSVMTQQRDLVTATLSIRHNMIMSETYNLRS